MPSAEPCWERWDLPSSLCLITPRGFNLHLSPFFAAVFAFCFALTIGAVWEIYEYIIDSTLGPEHAKIHAQGRHTADWAGSSKRHHGGHYCRCHQCPGDDNRWIHIREEKEVLEFGQHGNDHDGARPDISGSAPLNTTDQIMQSG